MHGLLSFRPVILLPDGHDLAPVEGVLPQPVVTPQYCVDQITLWHGNLTLVPKGRESLYGSNLILLVCRAIPHL